MKTDPLVRWHQIFAERGVTVIAFEYTPRAVAGHLRFDGWDIMLDAVNVDSRALACTAYHATRSVYQRQLQVGGNSFTHDVRGNDPRLIEHILDRLKAEEVRRND